MQHEYLRHISGMSPLTEVPCWKVIGSSGGMSRRGSGGDGGRVALCLMEGLEYMELTFGNGPVESLWIRIKGQANSPDIIMRVCDGPLSQDDSTDELFFKELRDT